MKRTVIALLLFVPSLVVAQDASVTYVEGGVDLQPSGGDRNAASIGDAVRNGDSIITASDGTAQLQKADQSELTVSPGTVFTLRQRDDNGTTTNVLAVSLGSIAYKFNQGTGAEPDVATPSAVAGIRGTAVTVYAGADGSSLFIVDSGKVSVQSQGAVVDVLPNEGVEVKPGAPPGATFKVLRGQIDYSTWNKQKLDNILLDPEAAAADVQKQMGSYVKEINDLLPQYQDTFAQLTANRAQRDAIAKSQGKDASYAYAKEKVGPLESLASGQFLNLRYYALSALSLKRYVLARMYVRLTTKFYGESQNPSYQKFLQVYQRVVRDFDDNVVPLLVPADI